MVQDAGIPESQAILISGHETRAMLERYVSGSHERLKIANLNASRLRSSPIQVLDYRFVAQIVISFGSKQLVSVTDAVKVAIGNAEYSVDVTTAETVLELTPTPTDDDLASVTSKLSNRTITSACLHMRLKRPIDFVHLFAPNFCGSSLSVWQGVIEYKEAGFRQIFDRLLQVSGLLYLCVGMEEEPELEDRHLQADTFPFGEEPLMISAIRRTEHEGNEWDVRRGPAFAD